MNIDVNRKNPALGSLFKDKNQDIFLDTNFLLPPDRSRLGSKPILFQKYIEVWLDALFDAFSNLAIHESVYDELVKNDIKAYVDTKSSETPPGLKIYTDSELSMTEKILMQEFIYKIAVYSKYIPERDNTKDRGEIRSLSYMAVKGHLYFATNDSLPKMLIRKAEELHTGLDNMELLEMYDIIFYLYKVGKYNNKGLKMLYKYIYYLTNQEKNKNPEWEEFIKKMDNLYRYES